MNMHTFRVTRVIQKITIAHLLAHNCIEISIFHLATSRSDHHHGQNGSTH